MQVKVTLNPSKGYFEVNERLLSVVPNVSNYRSAVIYGSFRRHFTPIDDVGTGDNAVRNNP